MGEYLKIAFLSIHFENLPKMLLLLEYVCGGAYEGIVVPGRQFLTILDKYLTLSLATIISYF